MHSELAAATSAQSRLRNSFYSSLATATPSGDCALTMLLRGDAAQDGEPSSDVDNIRLMDKIVRGHLSPLAGTLACQPTFQRSPQVRSVSI